MAVGTSGVVRDASRTGTGRISTSYEVDITDRANWLVLYDLYSDGRDGSRTAAKLTWAYGYPTARLSNAQEVVQ